MWTRTRTRMRSMWFCWGPRWVCLSMKTPHHLILSPNYMKPHQIRPRTECRRPTGKLSSHKRCSAPYPESTHLTSSGIDAHTPLRLSRLGLCPTPHLQCISVSLWGRTPVSAVSHVWLGTLLPSASPVTRYRATPASRELLIGRANGKE